MARELFEETDREPIIPLEKAKEYALDTGKAGSAIKAMQGSDGWAIFLQLIRDRKAEIYAKEDFPTLDAFRASRDTIKQIEDAISELDDLVEDAGTAATLFNRLSGVEPNPGTAVALSTGEAREG